MDDKETATLVFDIFSWIMNNVPDLSADEKYSIDKIIHKSSLVVEGWQEGE